MSDVPFTASLRKDVSVVRLFVYGKSARALALLVEGFRVFHQSFQANAGVLPQIRLRWFSLPPLFQFINH